MILSKKEILEKSVPFIEPINTDIVSVVYFLIKDNEIVYVGHSKDGYNRILCHKKQHKKQFDSYTFIVSNNTEERKRLESEYISKLNTIYNKYNYYKLIKSRQDAVCSSNRLREILKEKCISVDYFAKKMNVTVSTVNNWTKRTNIKQQTKEEIAKGLDMKVAQIFKI